MSSAPAARPASAPRAWHALPAGDVLEACGSDGKTGLSRAQARRRLEQHGPNALPEPPARTLLALLLHQFQSPLIHLLLAAALLALALGETSDGVVIAVVVLLNAAIGALQEGRAERALSALRRITGVQCLVLRAGREERLAARDVVPGDVLVLAPGDAVAADARLIEEAALRVSEAALTGESLPVEKDVAVLVPEAPLFERTCMVYAGTHVAAGRGRAVVVSTGAATEVGRITALAEAASAPRTPLEQRIARFGRAVMIAAGALFLLVIGLGLLRGLALEDVALIGISQVVGVVPEGLPVALTIALAVGVQRMARRRAIVRRLAAVETLGCTTVICSDKTGTLTQNEMTVTTLHLVGRGEVQVGGTGYVPVGCFTRDGAELDVEADPDLGILLAAGALCNDARLLAPDSELPRWRAVGDPTEAALIALAIKGGLVPDELRAHQRRRVELPFDPATRRMATEHELDGRSRVLLKGAPEAVLELCGLVRTNGVLRDLDDRAREEARAAVESMAARALRVLAIAAVEDATLDGRAGVAALSGRFALLGLVGQIDPPREGAAEAVRRCSAAGIRPVMVTGDHGATALAVARALGIARAGDVALEGGELEALSRPELAAVLERVSVFARVQPAQKLRIVEAYQERGAVVAMTGDGVNDAPALVRADVGVAMGSGTDAAKEAAKIVVTDDDFATIVAAVEEGRIVYRNIQKAILLLLTTAAAEVLVLLAALALGYPAPFAAVQILWNNLVTEGVITVNLAMEPGEGDEMRQRPIAPGTPLLSRAQLPRFLCLTLAILLSTLGWFAWRLHAGVPLAAARTETFTLLAVCEWFNVLNCRSERRSAFSLGLLRNPWLLGGLLVGNGLQVAVVFWAPMNRLFHTVPFDLGQVLAIGAAGSLVLWVEEARKWTARRRERAGTGPPAHAAEEALRR